MIKITDLKHGKYQNEKDYTPEEMEIIKADIEANGVLEPIEYDENNDILDGHMRVMLILKLQQEGKNPDYKLKQITGLTEEEKLARIRSKNEMRRHIDKEEMERRYLKRRRDAVREYVRFTKNGIKTSYEKVALKYVIPLKTFERDLLNDMEYKEWKAQNTVNDGKTANADGTRVTGNKGKMCKDVVRVSPNRTIGRVMLDTKQAKELRGKTTREIGVKVPDIDLLKEICDNINAKGYPVKKESLPLIEEFIQNEIDDFIKAKAEETKQEPKQETKEKQEAKQDEPRQQKEERQEDEPRAKAQPKEEPRQQRPQQEEKPKKRRTSEERQKDIELAGFLRRSAYFSTSFTDILKGVGDPVMNFQSFIEPVQLGLQYLKKYEQDKISQTRINTQIDKLIEALQELKK